MLELAQIMVTLRDGGGQAILQAKDVRRVVPYGRGAGAGSKIISPPMPDLEVTDTAQSIYDAIRALWDQYNAAIAGDYESVTAHASGSSYSLTDSPAALTFGTDQSEITLPQTGDWMIRGAVKLAYNGATVSAETATLKLRKTSDPAEDLGNSSQTIDLPASTTLTHDWGYVMAEVVLEDAPAGAVINWFGEVSATLAAGTIDATAAWIIGKRIQ